MLQSDIISQLRERYGFADVAAYPDSILESYINSAMKKISQYYPKIMRGSLDTVVDQTRYIIEEDGLIGIKDVYYTTSSAGSASINSSSTFGPSSTFTALMIAEMKDRLTPSGAEVVSYDTFDLIPTPQEVLKVYYDYKALRTLVELPEIFEEDVLSLILHKFGVEKFKKASAQNGMSGNPYKFDRRGNIGGDDGSSVAEVQKTLDSEMSVIIKSIKTKAMSL